MKNLHLIILIVFAFESNSFSQKNSGTYAGIMDNSPIIATMKISNGAIVGAFYKSRKVKHSLMGTVENNKIEGTIDMTGSFLCQGFFKDDSLLINISLTPNLTNYLKLKKINNKTSIDFDKYFGKETNDPLLYGNWILLSRYDILKKEFKNDKNRGMTLYSDGSYSEKGVQIRKDMSLSWYTSDNNLSMRISLKEQDMSEYNFGRYKVSGDTIITQNERHICKYLKKK